MFILMCGGIFNREIIKYVYFDVRGIFYREIIKYVYFDVWGAFSIGR